MTGPSAEQSVGYDIVIWMEDDESPTLARSLTILGEAILHALDPSHKMGKCSELTTEPENFFADVPKSTRIGLLNPSTNSLQLVQLGGLHG